jgi:hypothetical protein
LKGPSSFGNAAATIFLGGRSSAEDFSTEFDRFALSRQQGHLGTFPLQAFPKTYSIVELESEPTRTPHARFPCGKIQPKTAASPKPDVRL